MIAGSQRTIHLNGHLPAPAHRPPEYLRPDIVLLGSIRAASEQIREELKVVGIEESHHTALLVLKNQGQLIASLAAELLRRYEKAGWGKAGAP